MADAAKSEEINIGESSRITREYLDSLLIEMRHVDGIAPSLEMKLYGHTFKTPIMAAAFSRLNTFHKDGSVETAKAFVEEAGVMWLGILESPAELENVCAAGAKTIRIVKPYVDNKDIIKEIEHAEKCGCIAVGMDIDHQFGSKTNWGYCREFTMGPKNCQDLKALVKSTRLPFIVKGVISEIDARKCLDAGVGGIVVSHHHGMVDYSLPPLRILPRIAKIINKQIPIFTDCSIARGADIFKALALGANAVAIGRSMLGPLGTDGMAGVQKLIQTMNNELHWIMAVTCSPDIYHIDPSVIWPKERN
jgi:isopentenyl diphosphate isomerase/L-lactate dehydrogenase-like FMN-dependent dehydrogenase